MGNLSEALDQWIDQHWSKILSGLQSLLRIDSVYDAATVTADQPYGAGVAAALDWMQDAIEAAGYPATTGGGRYLYTERRGDDAATSRRIDVVNHIDVVSVGEGWTYPAFGAIIADDRLYGRGTQDMKTSLWTSWVAFLALGDLAPAGRNDLRLVFGGNEERTMDDMDHYVADQGLPYCGFTPVGDFPVGLGEYGVYMVEFEGEVTSQCTRLTTHQSANVVSDQVDLTFGSFQAAGRAKDWLELHPEIQHEWIGDRELQVLGVSSHTSEPDKGVNALIQALKLLGEAFDEAWAYTLWSDFHDYRGARLGLVEFYPPMGPPAVSLSQMQLTDGKLRAKIDIRYPGPLMREDFDQVFRIKLAAYNWRVIYHQPVTQTEIDEPFVQALLKVVEGELGYIGAPYYYSGGVTYCKTFDGRLVSFGPRWSGDGVEPRAHQRDEYITLDQIKQQIRIYAQAMHALVTMDLTQDQNGDR